MNAARLLLLLSALVLAGAACAQVSAGLSLLSDYRFRGVSQSGRGPALQGSLAFDHASGLFGGLFVSSVDFNGASSTNVETLAYAGIARRLTSDWSWEAGGTAYRYPGYDAARDPDFAEAFIGLTWRELNSRLYYSNDYFGLGLDSFYLELNGSREVRERMALFWHAGFTRVRGRGPRSRIDLQAGAAFARAPFTLELSAVATDAGGGYCPRGVGRCRPGLVVALSRSF